MLVLSYGRSDMRLLLSALTATLVAAASAAAAGDGAVDFNRDIRPLLAAKCFACHGPDEEHREADLRLDARQVALEYMAIVPGKPEESGLIERIFADDPEIRMPPPQANDSLTKEQKQLFRRWIEQGADYEPHWSFVPPLPQPLPESADAAWPRNLIDHFVLARLEAEGLKPSPEADRYALVRRVCLDLIGLPPTPEEADAFVHSDDPQAYEQLVDRLLASQHYGERWAREWLDLARYSDTNGYEKDRERSIWPYRDWVIRALNDDMPYDQFTIEQLAGDMLPDATASQRVATGFHRNTMLNEEGGIDPLEYRFYAMVDRVATTGTVWMGLTTGCAQCHTHKYDPITHTDYYRLMALLDNADEPDLLLKTPDVLKRRKAIQTRISALEAELPAKFPPLEGDGPIEQRRRRNLDARFQQWLAAASAEALDWNTLRPAKLESNLPKLEILDDGSIFSSGDVTKRDVFTLTFDLNDAVLPLTALRLEVLPDDRLPAGGPGRSYYEGRKGDFFLSEVTGRLDGEKLQFGSPSHSYGKISIGSGSADAGNVLDGNGSTGWSTAEREGEPHQLVLNLAEPITTKGALSIELLFERHFAASLGRFRFSAASSDKPAAAKQIPVELEALLARRVDSLDEREVARLRQHFLRTAPELAEARKRIDELRSQLPDFPTTMVMQERPHDNPRVTHRHHRGEFLSPKEEVEPGIPAFLMHGEEGPGDRLSFARWLVSNDNPLTARVTVNRAWQSFFGAGLVRSSGDFGTQGDAPTHPELLDALAREFIDNGWSLKRLHRLIVTSATYRQNSHGSPALRKRDPENRLLARGPSHRVDAEIVRDIMLSASGLLSPKMFGPGVYPPQPDSVTALAYGNVDWKPSAGEDRYRRSLYTFSKRTAPFAAYAVFDAPTGETCIASRDRSNTPLQALTLLNDEMFLEMSRALAKRALNETGSGNERDIATRMFRRLLTRPPEEHEISAIVSYCESQRQRLIDGELKPSQIAGDEQATPEQAAWAMTVRALMNLDEAITKP
jgi:hypothetical protein